MDDEGPCADDMDVGVSDRRDAIPPSVEDDELPGALDMKAARGAGKLP